VVLVVEDNHQVRDVAVAMIEDSGLEVLDAACGDDALAIIAARPDIDLMLSDVVMPGMNGPELAARALTLRPDLKVLFASGYTAGNLEEVPGLPRGLELVNKPFTREDLIAAVTRALEPPAAAAAAAAA
jgi:CheY-like chemotaxis protein